MLVAEVARLLPGGCLLALTLTAPPTNKFSLLALPTDWGEKSQSAPQHRRRAGTHRRLPLRVGKEGGGWVSAPRLSPPGPPTVWEPLNVERKGDRSLEPPLAKPVEARRGDRLGMSGSAGARSQVGGARWRRGDLGRQGTEGRRTRGQPGLREQGGWLGLSRVAPGARPWPCSAHRAGRGLGSAAEAAVVAAGAGAAAWGWGVSSARACGAGITLGHALIFSITLRKSYSYGGLIKGLKWPNCPFLETDSFRS